MHTTTGSRKRARRVSVASIEIGKPSSQHKSTDQAFKRMKHAGSVTSPIFVPITPSVSARQIACHIESSCSVVSSLDSFESFNGDLTMSRFLTTEGPRQTISIPNHTVRVSHQHIGSTRSSSTSLSSLCSDTVISEVDSKCSYKTEEHDVPTSPRIETAVSFVTPSCQPTAHVNDGAHLWIGRRSKQMMRSTFVLLVAIALFAAVSEQAGTSVLSTGAISRRTWPSVGQSRVIPNANSVCVSGGGFSGFWYTLGRLESIPDRSGKKYFCYSAGCLGVVASLSNYTMEQMWDMAYSVQMRWKRGEISRYQVVNAFLDDLLYAKVVRTKGSRNDNQTVPVLDEHNLSLINVITTVKSGRMGLASSVRSPTSIESLRTMLIQTSWIPFAIGDDLWYDGHMDGAFTVGDHPACEHHVGLTLDWDLYINVVNVDLGRSKVEKFWNKGLSRGL